MTDDFLGQKKEEITDFPKDKVVMRVLHTRTEIHIYPNGNTFQRSQSWFEGQTYEVKKKDKKKAKPTQKILTSQEETY